MELFQPYLALAVEPDREYTLHAVTIAPNSSFSAGRARQGVPPNVRLLPEVLSVLLPLRARRGPSLMVLTPVRHRLRDLRLGPGTGHTAVTAFTMVGDQVVGSATIPFGGAQPCPRDPVPVDTADWYAWVNRMPPGPPSFHVTGTVLLPTPGHDVSLEYAAPQGINPAELILDLRVTPRPGIWPQVVTSVSVRYDQAPYEAAYSGVLVREPDGDAVQLEVEEVF